MGSSIARTLRESESATVLLGAAGLFWVVEVVDSILLGDRLQGGGIHPRSLDGLDGIVWAPFLHSSFGHLISNTIPFLILGGLLAVRGVKYLISISVQVVILSGLAVWLVGASGNHIGASGLIFGYLGALIGGAFFQRKLSSIVSAVVAVLLYGTMVFGFLPRSGISWESHLFGFLAGLLAARLAAQGDPDRDLAP